MTTPLPPWQGYTEFVANPASGGAPPAPSYLVQDDGVSDILQDDGVSLILA